MLTQESLKKLFKYNPLDGSFLRLVTTSNNARANTIAGCISVQGYRVIRIGPKLYRTNRLAFLYMTGQFPVFHVDHKDGDTLNDRWLNLREATVSQNLANAKLRADNTSGYKSVTWFAARKKWMVKICVRGKHKTLGYTDNPVDGAAIYAEAAKKYFGEFARVT